jgi:alpha 1,3-glucosidase
MYNSDVFEYELDSPMTLYGSIPFMQAQRAASAVGVFWLNAAETWVDIVKTRPAARANPLSLGVRKESPSTQTHWISESGLLDVFVFLGPTPRDVLGAYTQLTGHAQLPPLFSLAYHQCRWNYFSAQDVRAVDRRFDAADIPYDVIWLDIEYTDDKKYFTWDARNFRDPVAMQRQLATHGRKLVAIIDPHIKNVADYRVAD